MINVTEKFIQLLNANSRTFRMKLVNGSEEYTNILNLKWFAALPSYLSIGNALCTCVECKAVGIPISIKGTYLDVYITVIGSDEWVQIGTFKAEKPTLQNGVVSFSAYDVMNECSKAIFAHKLGTVTIGECYETVIADIESEIGTVSYVPLPPSVASLKINADLLIGYDCRNVLAYIAGYLGCNCVVNNIGAIEMRGFTVCDYTLNDNRIAEPELDDDISDLEFLACSVNSETKLLYGNNGEGFEFICPIMTQERLNQIGATLCASTSVINVYRSGKIKHLLGDLRLQIGDVVSLEHNGETHIIPISSTIFEFDGGLSADIESLPLAEASSLSLSDTLDFISKQNANKRITGITNYYLATSETEGVTKDRLDWSDTIQKVTADKKYLWNYEVVTLADGTLYETEPCIIGNFAEKGSNGRGIKSITEYYLTTQTESEPSKSSFKSTVQTPTETLPFLWNYEKIEYDDESEAYESDVRIIGVYGSDGKTLYTWVRYADDASGTNMSDSPTGKAYIGFAYNKTTETESNTALDYTWSLIKGTDGKGVSKVETWYFLSTSESSLVGGSWSTSAPTWVDGRYLWTKLVTTYTDGSTKESDPTVDASWKKTTAVEIASKELNETLAGALGLHLTEVTISGSKVRYYHTNPTLSASKMGDTILVLNANGFGVCKLGWNGGNPKFTYGTTFDGKAVWDILTANKINADLIEAGKIKSVDGAAVKTELDLDTGNFILETADTLVTIKGAETDSNGIEHSAGIEVASKAKGDNFNLSLSGLVYTTFEYALEWLKYILSGDKLDKPEDPYYSAIQPQDIKTANLHCKNIFMSDGNGGEWNLINKFRTFVDDTGREVSELRTAVQNLEAVLNTHSHSYTSMVTKSATCTEEGTRKFTCSCGDSYTESIPALGHNYTSVVTPPTETAQGYTTYTCTRCGDSYIGNYTDPTGSPTQGATLTINASPSNAGTVSPSGNINCDYGEEVVITATAYSSYRFSHWLVNGEDPGLPTGYSTLSVIMYDESQTVTAVFVSDESGGGDSGETVTIKVSASGKTSNDYIQINSPTGSALGTQIELTDGESCTIYADTISSRKITQVEQLINGESQFTALAINLVTRGWLTANYRVLTIPVSFDDGTIGNTQEFKVYFDTV